MFQPARLPCAQSAIPVLSEVGFAWDALAHFEPCAAVVTGTNGKSTTTTFCAQLLNALGHAAWAGGNLGTPLSDLALEAVVGGRLGEWGRGEALSGVG